MAIAFLLRPRALLGEKSRTLLLAMVCRIQGYYDEMTNTFEEINEKRDIIEKDWHVFHEFSCRNRLRKC